VTVISYFIQDFYSEPLTVTQSGSFCVILEKDDFSSLALYSYE